jgi:hypothetical protein
MMKKVLVPVLLLQSFVNFFIFLCRAFRFRMIPCREDRVKGIHLFSTFLLIQIFLVMGLYLKESLIFVLNLYEHMSGAAVAQAV